MSGQRAFHHAASERRPGEHAAILHARYIDLILRGKKTIEARLSVNRIAPFGMVSTGDAILFRGRGEREFALSAVAARVWSFEGLTPRGVRALSMEFGQRVGAERVFWNERANARYATLVELTDARAISRGPTLVRRAGDRRAWFVLNQSAWQQDTIAA